MASKYNKFILKHVANSRQYRVIILLKGSCGIRILELSRPDTVAGPVLGAGPGRQLWWL